MGKKSDEARPKVTFNPLLPLMNFKREIIFMDDTKDNPDGGAPIPTKVPFTYGLAAIQALFGAYPDERGLPSVERNRRFATAMKIQAALDEELDSVTLSAREAETIKLLAGKGYTTLICGLLCQALGFVTIEKDEDDE